PAVIEGDPGKSHSLHCRQSIVDLLRLEVASVAPRTPDRTESAVGSFCHLEPLFHHEAAVSKQGLKIISFMYGNERAKRTEIFVGLQGLVMTILHANSDLASVRHGNRQRNQLRTWFDVTDPNAHIFAPHVNKRCAAAIVAGVHAKIILLIE